MIKQVMLCVMTYSLMLYCANLTMLNITKKTKSIIEMKIDWTKNVDVDRVYKAKKAFEYISYVDYDTPSNNSFKSYMAYTTITDVSSKQYSLQLKAVTGEYGIRMVGDRYCIAVGSYYTTTIGKQIDLVMQNGNIIKCILADCKDDVHTDSTNRQNPNGSIVEFIIDNDNLNKTAKKMGNISYCDDMFKGEIVYIRIFDE